LGCYSYNETVDAMAPRVPEEFAVRDPMSSNQMPIRKAVVVRVILTFLIAGAAAYALQAAPFSLRHFLIESTVLTGPELGVLEIIVGFVNSVIITAICVAILRRPVIHIAATAAITQMLWIEWAYSFRQGGETFALAVLRYTEHVGVMLGAAAVVILLSRFRA
jgi:hypothetical protein